MTSRQFLDKSSTLNFPKEKKEKKREEKKRKKKCEFTCRAHLGELWLGALHSTAPPSPAHTAGSSSDPEVLPNHLGLTQCRKGLAGTASPVWGKNKAVSLPQNRRRNGSMCTHVC